MKIAMLQQNCTVGDFDGNATKILAGYHKSCTQGAELVISTELAIFGYPPKDMLERDDYVQAQLRALERVKREIGSVGLVIGYVHIAAPLNHDQETRFGPRLYNTAALLQHGEETETVYKSLLPTYDVFDEARYFVPNTQKSDEHGGVRFWDFHGQRIAVLICEDIWHGTPDAQKSLHALSYLNNPLEKLFFDSDSAPDGAARRSTKKQFPADMLIAINASPYYWGKGMVRYGLVRGIAKKYGWCVCYVNQVGGNDDLVFDGRSFAVSPSGDCIAKAEPFAEDIVLFEPSTASVVPYPSDHDNIKDLYDALVLGLRDYYQKTGHDSAVIGLSGGIDSAVTACIAKDALGPKNVFGISMPSRFSSPESVPDARELAYNLGIDFTVAPINKIYEAARATLTPIIGWHEPGSIQGDATEENVQARTRMLIEMAKANRKGAKRPLLLSTGNKSELSVGFCTLYGDMAGGFGVISDVYKTVVYALARYINRTHIIIPEQSITKPPSAELCPNQKDSDTLPPYETLDAILEAYVDEGRDREAIVAMGHSEKTVRWVIRALNCAEHKHRNATLGLKVSRKAFGSGRRWPIAAKFLE